MAVLRSSTHRAEYSRSRKLDPGPTCAHGSLPPALTSETVIAFDKGKYGVQGAVIALLRRAPPEVGNFREAGPDESATPQRLEDFVVPDRALLGTGGSCELAQQQLTQLMASDSHLLSEFERLVEKVVLPNLKARLEATSAAAASSPVTFHYQHPPTLRLQPGPSTRHVRRHHDGEYGHQRNDLNFWMPLTSRALTRTTLWAESHEGAADDHPLEVDHGEIAAFHGSVCRHHVPANPSDFTRCSIDFRVGIDGWFDPQWSMRGTKQDPGRRTVSL